MPDPRTIRRNSPAYIPLWLAKRQWRLDGRKRGDGIYWPVPMDLCARMRWDPMPTFRPHWRWVPGWQRANARMLAGFYELPF